MGIVNVYKGDPLGKQDSRRRYTNQKNWDKQSEDLRGKPWEEVFNLIKKQFEYERLDMQKLKSLLGRLSPKTNWSKVLNELTEFFEDYEKKRLKRKKFRGDEYSYSEEDELRFQRKQLLNTLRMRANAKNEWEKLDVEKHFSAQSADEYEEVEDVEENSNVIKIENRFDKVKDWEDKIRKEYGTLHEGDHSLNRDNPQEKRIAAERGARENRKEERRYF